MKINRSYLFVPATKIKVIEKAVYSDADCIILDLEDAVAKSEKQNARLLAIEALKKFKDEKPIYVRINDLSTLYWEDDLECALLHGASGIVLPKAESKMDIKIVSNKIQQKKITDNFEVIPLIESAKGIQFIYEIVTADEMVSRLAFGSIDFSLDIDCQLTSNGYELLFARSQIVIASKAAGVAGPIDAVFPDLNNESGLKNEADFARQIGFKAKLIIHPKQIETVHHVFSPSKEEIEEAKQIVSAFEEAEKQGVASISVDNKLVDYPVYRRAKEILSII
ncbi:CoA ester lyase [Alkalihalobacillus sp. MEB130]|uniref:HpcH/HpaI aldolase/citrate lyase family protein n=1 Tax=Alkalihalobacillus sp. MEB130 TaxID=2976704 RepID=UPI0028DF885F|nr:CoA ester lyase [Alkalihalobacillus sp. MEB130]MDT8861006.1 CoA ester lyase [Alkalihalobacillus sp. MEB130]